MTPESLAAEVDELSAEAGNIDPIDGRDMANTLYLRVLRAIASGECTQPRECAAIVLKPRQSALYW